MNIVIILLLGYSVLLTGLFFFQRKLLYHPDDSRPVPAQFRLYNAQKLDISGHDRTPLFSWYQEPSEAGGTIILYFHGNAGSIADRADKALRFESQGYGMLFPSYRYNAGNGGTPSEEALIGDGLAVYDWLVDAGYGADQIVIYGESLGTGVAVAVATRRDASAVILEAPYSSIADVAQGVYWYTPALWLVRDSFDSTKRISEVEEPILIVHGAADRTIPIKYGRKLHAAAPEKSQFVEITGAGHDDLYDHGMGEHVFRFLKDR